VSLRNLAHKVPSRPVFHASCEAAPSGFLLDGPCDTRPPHGMPTFLGSSWRLLVHRLFRVLPRPTSTRLNVPALPGVSTRFLQFVVLPPKRYREALYGHMARPNGASRDFANRLVSRRSWRAIVAFARVFRRLERESGCPVRPSKSTSNPSTSWQEGGPPGRA
jgi:hypothetical protein